MNPYETPESSTEYGECMNPECRKRLEANTLTLAICVFSAYTLGVLVGYNSYAAYSAKLDAPPLAWQQPDLSPPEIDPETGDLKPLTEEEFGRLRDWLKRRLDEEENKPETETDSDNLPERRDRPILRRILSAAFGWFDAPNKLERLAWASLIIVPMTVVILAWLRTRKGKQQEP